MPEQIDPARRALSRATLGSGPLKRGSDRVELASRLLCALVVVLAFPVALLVGTVVGMDTAAQARAQAASRTEVTAVLLVDAPDAGRGEIATLSVATPATWRAPDGTRREGTVRALRTAAAGDPVDIWVDPSGTSVDRPLGTSDVVLAALFTGFTTLLVMVGAAVGGHLVVCRLLWRHRSRRWEQEWRAVEPLWAGR
ncbi:Rv1733c family protein [Blastococcus sp. VKM Ac-2987]|uniref:Rv1733c family protein n=1 Tax=Blastococcus sp. VKM Ac-2987 TaxID=3004141 RepID=UPI0022AB5466|nr:hypothetical protein [Blastococcus sp. VKM Ac-2987]MCZ2860627.1 hypothetical protein [Blastococcus sp. VKM Ac-2987]